MTEKRQNVRSRSFLLTKNSAILPVVPFNGNERVHLLPNAAKSPRRLTLLVVALALLLTAWPSAPRRNGGPTPGNTWHEQLSLKGAALRQAGAFQQAAELYQQGFQIAIERKDWGHAIQFLSNVGGSRFALFQYREALQAYLEAKRLTESHSNPRRYPLAYSNLSALYLELGNLNPPPQVA